MKYGMLLLALALIQVQIVRAEEAAAKAPAAEQPKAAPADAKPAPAAEKPAAADAKPGEARPLEEVLKTEKDPNGKHIMVLTHILVVDPNAKQGLKVRFVDVKPSPNVYIKEWAPKVRELKAGTLLAVKGELHFGATKSGTPSIRYKVREISGRKYNDHRHWRTDRAIYIINPTHEIIPADSIKIEPEPKEAEPKDEVSKEEKPEAP